MQESRTFIPQDFVRIQSWLGKRPGDYKVDPYYLRRGFHNKVQFWDASKRQWKPVRIGDKFIKSQDGVIHIVNQKGGRA